MRAPRERFLAGVVEGFYGTPWTHDERLGIFDELAAANLDTYCYAAKDDPKHRACWREPYADGEAQALAALIGACHARGLRFVYGLGPGLDFSYSSDSDAARLQERVAQVLALGADHVALLFDDIPDALSDADRARFAALGAAQSAAANTLLRWMRDHAPAARLLVCPTAYCGRMAEGGLGGPSYLDLLGRLLAPDIDVFWTGPEIVSREITVAHVRAVAERLRRKPVIWDNLHANDYDGRRFYCGPYAGRPPALRDHVAGIVSNPNTEAPLNRVALRTLGRYLACEGEWNPRAAYLEAMREWHPTFATTGPSIDLADLVLLGDCFYLPFDDGDEAERMYVAGAMAVAAPSGEAGNATAEFLACAARVRALCARLTELRERRLFHALSRRIWDLREEVDLLERYVRARTARGPLVAPGLGPAAVTSEPPFRSDAHLPGTFRGGMIARLQRLLVQQPDGSFLPRS